MEFKPVATNTTPAPRAQRLIHSLPSALSSLRTFVTSLGSKGYLLAVGAIVLLVGSALSQHFMTSRNLISVLITASVVSVLAVGQYLVIVTGGIDLSVGAVAAVSSVIAGLALQQGTPWPLAVLLALLTAGLIGIFNGLMIVYGGITPFIVTLAMMSIARGVAYMLQTGRQVAIEDQGFLAAFTGNVGPMPAPVMIALLVTIVFAVVMAQTRFGRRLFALGGNAEAARLSGLPIKRDIIGAYCLSSLLAGLGGVMIAAQLTEGSAIIGEGYELNAIAAVVVGGASLFGGTGDPVSAVLGGLIIAVILNIMDLLGIQAQPQLIVKGAVILLAVLFTSGVGNKLPGALRKLLFQQRYTGKPAAEANRAGAVPASDKEEADARH
ncbi:ABC transporter permease [Microbacterium sp. NPDC089318]